MSAALGQDGVVYVDIVLTSAQWDTQDGLPSMTYEWISENIKFYIYKTIIFKMLKEE